MIETSVHNLNGDSLFLNIEPEMALQQPFKGGTMHRSRDRSTIKYQPQSQRGFDAAVTHTTLHCIQKIKGENGAVP